METKYYCLDCGTWSDPFVEIDGDMAKIYSTIQCVYCLGNRICDPAEDRNEFQDRLLEMEKEAKHQSENNEDIYTKIWDLIYPGKTDWGYPGMVYRHVKAELEDRDKDLNTLVARAEQLERGSVIAQGTIRKLRKEIEDLIHEMNNK